MNTFRPSLLVAMLLLCAYPAGAQTSLHPNSNGAIMEQAHYLYPLYDQLPDALKRSYTKEVYEKLKSRSDFECLRIKYSSDGLKVVGFIYKPKRLNGKKYPAIIFNRGGVGEASKIGVETILNFRNLASEGFIILATQYRGNDGGEGKDEFGGADVNDIINLIPLARSLGYIDMNNLFMWGFSRGGMMTFLAIKNGVPINAAATVGATLDFTSPGPLPPQAAQRLRNLWPDYENRAEEHQTNRSAMKWAERINVPTLILHGGADRNVSASQALAFAQRLQELGKVYELMIYAGDDHGLSLNRADVEERMIRWFKKHIK